MLERVDSDDLSVFAVWMPVLDTDNPKAALEAESLLDDSRVVHYWDERMSLGKFYGSVLELPRGDLAWDTFFVYAPGVEWTERPPTPTSWMHQLARDSRRLHGKRLREAIVDLLPTPATSEASPSR